MTTKPDAALCRQAFEEFLIKTGYDAHHHSEFIKENSWFAWQGGWNARTPATAPANKWETPDGRPIFGEGSPHDVEEHLDGIASAPAGEPTEANYCKRDAIEGPLLAKINAMLEKEGALPDMVNVELMDENESLKAENKALLNTATATLMMDKAREGYEAERSRIEAPLKAEIARMREALEHSYEMLSEIELTVESVPMPIRAAISTFLANRYYFKKALTTPQASERGGE